MDEFSKPAAARTGSSAADEPVAAPGIDGEADAISEAELREFMAADTFGATADPAFKRRLKGRLWEIVEARLQPKLRDKWAAGWRRRELSAVEETGSEARRKR